MWRARSTPRWGQVAGCWKSDSELGWRRSKLEPCGQMLSHKESKQQKDPLHTTNTEEKARRNKEEGFCNSVHCGKKEAMKQLGSRGSNNIFKRITWGKPGPSLPITYADMSSGIHNFLKSSPNGVPLKNSHQFSLIWQFLHWPSNFLKPTFKTIVTSYSFDRSVSHKNLLTEGTKKSDTSSKTTLFKLFSQLTLICLSLLIPPTTTTTPFVFVLFEALSFKHVKE